MALVVLPMGAVVGSTWNAEIDARQVSKAVPWRALGATAVYAGLIGILATLAGLPAAWVVGRGQRARMFGGCSTWNMPPTSRGVSRDAREISLVSVVLIAIAIPMLMPSYIPYAGWGQLRGPNTFLGDLVARQSPRVSIAVGRGVAVLGMVLWLWPLAAVVLAGTVSRVSAATMESLRLDSPRVGRAVTLAWMLRRGLGASVGCVALVVMGSAIPLHVAQAPTYAIELWKQMQVGTNSAAIWVAAAPLLILAGAGAWVISRRVLKAPGADMGEEDSGASSRGGRWAAAATAGVWALSVVVPAGLFVWSLRSWRSVGMFWRVTGEAVGASAAAGAAVGLVVALITVLTWACIANGRWFAQRAVRLALVTLLFAALTPGVLLGTAVGAFWNQPIGVLGLVGDSPAVIVLAHVARFGFIGVLAGVWLSRLESREERGARMLEGGDSLFGWWSTRVRPRMLMVAGIGLAAGALSLHEIETTIMVEPPGWKSLARTMLDHLHFSREEQLAAAGLNMVLIGLAAAGIAGLVMALGTRRDGPNATAAVGGGTLK